MKASYNKSSFIWGVPGIILQITGNILSQTNSIVGIFLALTGTVLLLIGLSFYSRSKGYHPAFCLFGLLSIIGLIILAVLPDKLVEDTNPQIDASTPSKDESAQSVSSE